MSIKDILIIEDDEAIRETLKLTLELEGYRVHSANNGEEGLAQLSQLPAFPGIILLDLMMPVMDGWEFIEAKNRHPAFSGIPVVIVSAFAEEARVIQSIKGVVNKPVDMNHLMRLVKTYCS